MRALIAVLLVLGPVACSGSADVSVGRNDPVASGTDRSSGNASDPWAGPTTVCDAYTCRIGDGCTLTIGSCVPSSGFAVGACAHVPETCSDELAPVCGCDGRSYPNACEAARAAGGLLSLTPCEE
jgi:hypothetical protein